MEPQKPQKLSGAVRKQVAATKRSSSTSSENKDQYKFEARPARVLYREPFKPLPRQALPVKIAPFQLTTEMRAAGREKFDQKRKEKELKQEKYKKQIEREMKVEDDKGIAGLRAKLIHHAKPIPASNYNPFIPHKSTKKITVPKSPKFMKRNDD